MIESRPAAVLALLLPLIAVADESPLPLFADDTVLPMEFRVNLDELCRNPDPRTCDDVPATLSYRAVDGSEVDLDVNIRTRGRHRKQTSDCIVPALFIDFDAAQTEGTLFEGQTMLPFTSHCRHSDGKYHNYMKKEYIAHRLYNLVTPASLEVRLARINYVDSEGDPYYERYGFFVEHFERAAERLGGRVIDVDELDPRRTDATELAKLSVFQYLIGNLDWSVTRQHNVALIEVADRTVVPLPYDFDYSGLVNTEYAVVSGHFRARNVKKRFYRGFCRQEIDWDEVFDHYLALRPAMTQLIESEGALSPRFRNQALRYVELFWKILTDPDKRQREIVDECRKMPSVEPEAGGDE